MAHRDHDGFTLIELLLVVAIIGIIAAIAAPGLLRARMAGDEASAIGSMRAISTAQHAYAGKCNGYAPVLTELGLAGSFLSPDMTSGPVLSKSGYTITHDRGRQQRRAAQPERRLHRVGQQLHRHGCADEHRHHWGARVRDRRRRRDLAGRHWRGAVAAVHDGRQRQHHSIGARG